MTEVASQQRSSARRLAVEVLVRVDRDSAYANVALPAALGRSSLDDRDRAFATELVYGVTRRRRALDWVLAAFLSSTPPAQTRAALRLGAYQLLELGTPGYAAVSASVEAAPRRHRGLVNAVLRRVAEMDAPSWPDDATRLSYPDWIVETLVADLGRDVALTALEQMNAAAVVHRRADGYVQDLSSQMVVDAMDVSAGDVVVDLCAAPGGKATALAERGAVVVACDSHPGRVRRLVTNRRDLRLEQVLPVVADGRLPALRSQCADVVLVDAPCSGLGALRRRPDARWRIERPAVARLAKLQQELLVAAADLLQAGGRLVYSVCTLTSAETLAVAAAVSRDSRLKPIPAPSGAGWLPHGDGALLLPDDQRDGMGFFSWRRV